MPIAAVPAYLGQDFSSASPGLRFGMYLPLWGENRRTKELLWSTSDMDYAVRGQQREEREIKVENKTHALQQACKLTAADKATMHALAQRQTHTAQTTSHVLTLDAIATAPFTTGLGNEHPLENGFAFLNPYGLPYLPGSGVKGVLRAAAQELARGEWGASDWSTEQRHEVHDKKGKRLFDASDLDVLFGSEALDGENHLRGVLSFWDVIPQIEGNSLMVDIMTPHQSHYYQGKDAAGSSTPHDSGSPNPISFLTVPPGSGFAFHVVCNSAQLDHLAPDLAANGRWKQLLTEAFEHAFAWLGFGAKTSVGYGAMGRDIRAEGEQARAQAEAQAKATQEAKRTALSTNALLVDDFVTACQSRAVQLRGGKDKPNTELHAKARALSKAALEGADWSTEEKRSAAQALADWLPQVVAVDMKDERKKLKLAVLRGGA